MEGGSKIAEPGPGARVERRRTLLETVTMVLVCLTCVTMIALAAWSTLQPPPATGMTTRADAGSTGRPTPLAPAALVSITGVAIRGDPRAPIGIIEYSDYQCPFCMRFESGSLPAIEAAYIETGKAFLAFKHYPIAALHPEAYRAAEAAECAARQGRFWPMHERLFASPKQVDPATLTGHAKALELDLSAFEACMRGEVAERVRADIAEAKQLGITGTPSFLIGRLQADGRVKGVEFVIGAQPAPVFASIIDRILAELPNPVPGREVK